MNKPLLSDPLAAQLQKKSEINDLFLGLAIFSIEPYTTAV